MKKRKPYQKDRKADYRGATPREVAEAVLRHRGRGEPVRPIRKRPEAVLETKRGGREAAKSR